MGPAGVSYVLFPQSVAALSAFIALERPHNMASNGCLARTHLARSTVTTAERHFLLSFIARPMGLEPWSIDGAKPRQRMAGAYGTEHSGAVHSRRGSGAPGLG